MGKPARRASVQGPPLGPCHKMIAQSKRTPTERSKQAEISAILVIIPADADYP